ncbi:MAG: hypothetical protein ABW061_04765, partial [Polyangiaceae bacterium]
NINFVQGVLLNLVLALALGCSKLSVKADEQRVAIASSEARPSAVTPIAPDGREITGLGFVPAWAADTATDAQCKAKDPARLVRLSQGADRELSAGTADLERLVAEVAGDCPPAKAQLATALNDGGFSKYTKQSYREANRWWQAALSLRPAHITARYNLACGLVLDGSHEDGLWMLGELARAANDGNTYAVEKLEKAKSDPDLKGVRESAAFQAAVKAAR